LRVEGNAGDNRAEGEPDRDQAPAGDLGAAAPAGRQKNVSLAHHQR